MKPSIQELIEKCTHESHAGLLVFPEVLNRLIGVGVESYFVDYRGESATYYFANNEALMVSMGMPQIEIQETFDKDAIVMAIRGAQSDQLRYPEFLRQTMSAGCIGYMVWISGGHVSYFGRLGEAHVEHFTSE